MSFKFSDEIKLVLQLSRDLSSKLKNDYVGTEHLLLVLLQNDDGMARQILRNLGADLDAIAQVVQKELADSPSVGDLLGSPIPFTPRVKKSLEIAGQEAVAMHEEAVASEHLLLSLAKDMKNAAAIALAGFGVEYAQIRLEVGLLKKGGPLSIPASPFISYFGTVLPGSRASAVAGNIKEDVGNLVYFGADLAERRRRLAQLPSHPERFVYFDMAQFSEGAIFSDQIEARSLKLIQELDKARGAIIPVIDDLAYFLCQGLSGAPASLESPVIRILMETRLRFFGICNPEWYGKYVPPELESALGLTREKAVV